MKYRVLEKSFINSALAQEGDIVEYNGKPGSNLELIKEAAKVKIEKPKAEAVTE